MKNNLMPYFLTMLFLLIQCSSTGQSFRAMFLNPNVYRTHVDLKVNRIMNAKTREVSNGSYTLAVNRPVLEGVGQQPKDDDVLDYISARE